MFCRLVNIVLPRPQTNDKGENFGLSTRPSNVRFKGVTINGENGNGFKRGPRKKSKNLRMN